MNYAEYIAYHKKGDAGVEERMIASLCRYFSLSEWDKFRLIYYYTMTYNIPSAIDMLIHGERNIRKLKFRTDRRYVRCNGAFPRLLSELNEEKFSRLKRCRTTQQAYEEVSSWYFFGRYAAFLFLEVWCNVFKTEWEDNVVYGWEKDENYTLGAVSIIKSRDRAALDAFLENVKKDTGDNAFAIETSLCAVWEFNKGTRYNGYYTERMLEEARGTEYETLIYSLAR